MRYSNYENIVKFEDKYETTKNRVFDFFSVAGGIRGSSSDLNLITFKVLDYFIKAYSENKLQTLQTLFYLRDIHNGMGERLIFRICLENLIFNDSKVAKNIIPFICKYGRYDDLLIYLDSPLEKDVVQYIRKQLEEDLAKKENENISLLAKWLPSINASDNKTRNDAKILSNALNLKYVEYRKLLSKLRKKLDLIENRLRAGDYTFDYSHVPSRAFFKYREAFFKKDLERFTKFIENSKTSKALNSSNLYPYEIVKNYSNLLMNRSTIYRNSEEFKNKSSYFEQLWNSIPKRKTKKNILICRDGSGSMLSNRGLPYSVATSLAILFSEMNSGIFKDKFMTFSTKPEIVDFSNCKSLQEKIDMCEEHFDPGTTNIEGVYNAIFEYISKSNGNRKDKVIDTVVIISDMEFDLANENKNTYSTFKELFSKNKLKLPDVVFWNVCGKRRMFSFTIDDTNCFQISGFSQHTFDDLVNCNLKDPIKTFKTIIKPYLDDCKSILK